jgi:hypothetical protein
VLVSVTAQKVAINWAVMRFVWERIFYEYIHTYVGKLIVKTTSETKKKGGTCLHKSTNFYFLK